VVSAPCHPEGDVTVVGPDGGLRVPKWMLAATAARFCVSAHATLSCSALLLLVDLVVLSTAAVTRVRLVEADPLFLDSAGKPFVDTLHAHGLKALGFRTLGSTAPDSEIWFPLEPLGVDGIYVDDIPFGVQHEAPIP
jgi:hypothetical protein